MASLSAFAKRILEYWKSSWYPKGLLPGLLGRLVQIMLGQVGWGKRKPGCINS